MKTCPPQGHPITTHCETKPEPAQTKPTIHNSHIAYSHERTLEKLRTSNGCAKSRRRGSSSEQSKPSRIGLLGHLELWATPLSFCEGDGLKGPLTGNSGVDRLQVEGHLGPQGKGYPVRLGRSGPKGPLIENSGVKRLQLGAHLGPQGKGDPFRLLRRGRSGRRVLS